MTFCAQKQDNGKDKLSRKSQSCPREQSVDPKGGVQLARSSEVNVLRRFEIAPIPSADLTERQDGEDGPEVDVWTSVRSRGVTVTATELGEPEG
jgi:hypothetical protein